MTKQDRLTLAALFAIIGLTLFGWVAAATASHPHPVWGAVGGFGLSLIIIAVVLGLAEIK